MTGLSTVEENICFSSCGGDRMHSRASGSFRSPRAPLALTLCLALRAAMATTSLARPHWTDAAVLDLSCDSAASLLLLLLLFPVSEPVPCTGA